jgi:hypothetical protein
MLGPRVALPAALVRALELLVQPLPASPPLPRATGLAVGAIIARVLSVATPPSRLSAVWGGRRGRLAVGTRARLHVGVELGLAQLGRCLHVQDLRHRRLVYAAGELWSCARLWGKSGLLLHGRVSAVSKGLLFSQAAGVWGEDASRSGFGVWQQWKPESSLSSVKC